MGLLSDDSNWMDSDQFRLGMGLLAAGSARGDGAGFGQRVLEGVASLDNFKKSKAEQKRQDQAMQMQQLQMHEIQQKLMQEKAMQALAAKFQGQPGMAPLQGDAASGILPSAGKPATGYDYQGYANAMAGIDPAKALALQQLLQKESTINKLDVKDFTPASVAKYALTKNYGDLVRLDKAHFANTGGQTMAMDPFTGKPLNIVANTQSPDSVASNATTMRGQNMTNALGWANNSLSGQRLAMDQGQFGKPQYHDGQWITPPTAQNPQGTAVQVPGYSKPLNDVQAKALLFGTRMQESDKVIKDLAGKNVTQPGLIKRAAEAVPFAGSAMGTLTNWTQSANQQSVEQAQRDFINATLRRESGAVISADEFDNGKKQYFPQPGDSEQVSRQKARNRELATQGILAEVPASRRNSLAPNQTPPAAPSGGATMRWNPKTSSLEMVN